MELENAIVWSAKRIHSIAKSGCELKSWQVLFFLWVAVDKKLLVENEFVMCGLDKVGKNWLKWRRETDRTCAEVCYQGTEGSVSEQSNNSNKWSGFANVFYLPVVCGCLLVYAVSKTCCWTAYWTFGNCKTGQFTSISENIPLSCRTVGSIKDYVSRSGSFFPLWFRICTVPQMPPWWTQHCFYLFQNCNLKLHLQTDDFYSSFSLAWQVW